MKDLLKKGKLAKKSCRGDRLWLTSDIMAKMASTLLGNAMAEGVMHWDFVLVKLLAILLPASIGARSGDVTRTHLYKGDEYTKWKDVVIRLRDSKTGPYGNELWGTISLEYCKTFK